MRLQSSLPFLLCLSLFLTMQAVASSLFFPGVTYGGGHYPVGIVAADFDGDGLLDLAVGDAGSFTILLGKGDGTLQPGVPYDGGGAAPSIAVGDFNRDGQQDLAIANRNSNRVSIVLGNGDGSFQPPLSFDAGVAPNVVTTADFNGDNILDLAVVNITGGNLHGGVSILLGNGDGTFGPAIQFNAGREPDSLAVGDFNGDGILDIVVGNIDVTVSVLLGKGDGSFLPPLRSVMGQNPDFVVVGDFNRDGKLDVAASLPSFGAKKLVVAFGRGDGTIQTATRYALQFAPGGVTTGDFNRDGILDLAVLGDEVSVLLGNGDGSFGTPRNYRSNLGSAYSLIAADLNGDHYLDLVATAPLNNAIAVLLNTAR